MIFLGYNFLKDRYCWQPVPTNLVNINDIILRNGIYDYFNITKDVDFPYIVTYPSEWDVSTQLDADFNGNINAGNIDYVISQISSIKIKKRKKGSFNWYTLYNVPIKKLQDINFVKYDYLGKNDTEYEYAIVPIIGNTEGEYAINSIKSEFYGVFITDGKNNYKFKEGASYSSNERVHQSTVFEPYGSKYPIVISNGQLSYDRGTAGGNVIVFTSDEQLDRNATVDRLQAIKNFLGTPSAKILKDFNGNIWLVSLSDNLPITYYSEVGMGFARVDFNWSEIGDANKGQDLYDSNLIYANN